MELLTRLTLWYWDKWLNTHTDSDCSQTWDRCRWRQQWGRWPDTHRSVVPVPGRWQWQTACTPSAAPGQNSVWSWWPLGTQTPPVLCVTASVLNLQKWSSTSPTQEEALTARSTTIKFNPHQPCNACLGQDQLQFPCLSPHATHYQDSTAFSSSLRGIS